jgi:hypothetical protein
MEDKHGERMSAKWALHHSRHGLMSFYMVSLIYTDPMHISNIAGHALFDTRATARTVMRKMQDAGYPTGGYDAVRVCVEVRVENTNLSGGTTSARKTC